MKIRVCVPWPCGRRGCPSLSCLNVGTSPLNLPPKGTHSLLGWQRVFQSMVWAEFEPVIFDTAVRLSYHSATVSPYLHVAYVHSQRAHDVNTTSPQRRCNVMTLHRRWGDVVLTSTSWRCIDVEPTLYKRHVPAGLSCNAHQRYYNGFSVYYLRIAIQISSLRWTMKNVRLF